MGLHQLPHASAAYLAAARCMVSVSVFYFLLRGMGGHEANTYSCSFTTMHQSGCLFTFVSLSLIGNELFLLKVLLNASLDFFLSFSEQNLIILKIIFVWQLSKHAGFFLDGMNQMSVIIHYQ